MAGFIADRRGQALQLDFLMSMVIRVVAFSILLAGAVALTYSMVGSNFADKQTAKRSADRLAGDLLVGNPSNTLLNESCTDAFFEANTSHAGYTNCGFNITWTSGSAPFLNDALAVNESKDMNATIERTDGSIATLDVNGNVTTLALGESPPQQSGSVFSWHRRVGLDVDGDGDHEWATVYVRVW